jgi:hypothetical protein
MAGGRVWLRLAIWLAGLCVAALPLVFAVAERPSGLWRVLLLDSYVPHVERVLFLIVAIGALLIAEGIDHLLDIDRARQGWRANFVGVLLLFVLLQVVIAAMLYGLLSPQAAQGCDAACIAVLRADTGAALAILGALALQALALKIAYFTLEPGRAPGKLDVDP